MSDGSYRNIVFKGGPSDLLVDLDKAGYIGDFKSDPCLYAGYVIHVPQKSNSRIQVIGEVNSPREIELLGNDNLKLLIALAGGFRNWADTNNVQLIRAGNIFKALDESIQSGDIIKVSPLADIPVFKSVFISGAVMKPGKLQAEEVSSLDELLERAGGFDPRAAQNRTTLFRFNAVDAAGRISTNRSAIQNIFTGNGPGGTFTLAGGDSVYVPYNIGYVEVSGEVAYPGTFPFQTGKTAEYYINSAGGFLKNANNTEIDTYDSISKVTSRHSPKIQIHDGIRITVIKREGLE